MVDMHAVGAFSGFPLFGGKLQAIDHVDTPDNQDAPVQFDFAGGFGGEPVLSGRNPARFQRASKGAGQSPGGCRHKIVERGGMRFVNLRIHAVMFGDFRVHPEQDGPGGCREVSAPQGAFDALDTNARTVDHSVGHGGLLSFDKKGKVHVY